MRGLAYLLLLLSIAPAHAARRAAVCSGTSLTFGYIQNTNPYPARLETALSVPVDNMGIGSARLSAIITRWRTYAKPFPYKTLVAEGGTNDIALDGALADDLWPVFQAWIEEAQGAGVSTVVAVAIPCRWGSSSWDSGKEAERLTFNQYLRDYVAANPEVRLVDSDVVLCTGTPKALQGAFDYGDDLHMSGDGMQALAEGVADLL